MILPALILAQTMVLGQIPFVDTRVHSAPLKCEPYQHDIPAHRETCSAPGDTSFCVYEVPARCADDMHTLTERDWQNLLKRMETLEAKASQ